MTRRAFTLVELLVVIGLICLMAAFFYPVMHHGGSRENARKSSCQNNLKQIALGFKQYQNDFDEYYPLVFVTDAPRPSQSYGWADAIQPYIKNIEVYQCPSDTNEGNQSPAESGYTDYWYNANFMRRINHKGKVFFKTVTEPGSSSQTILLGDGGSEDSSGGHNATYNQCGDGKSLSGRNQICSQSKSMTATYPAARIHLDGANFAFADGHVKWLRGNNPTQSVAVLSNRADYSNIGHKYTFWLNNNWLKKKP